MQHPQESSVHTVSKVQRDIIELLSPVVTTEDALKLFECGLSSLEDVCELDEAMVKAVGILPIPAKKLVRFARALAQRRSSSRLPVSPIQPAMDAGLVDTCFVEHAIDTHGIPQDLCKLMLKLWLEGGLNLLSHESCVADSEIGRGYFGSVFHGNWLGREVAIKVIKQMGGVGMF